MSGFLKEKDELPLQGGGWTDFSDLERVCVSGTDKSKTREVAQETTGSGVAKMCRKTPSAFTSLFGTRSKKSQKWDLGPRGRGYISRKDRMTQVWVTTSASGRAHLRENREERCEAKALGQVVRVHVAKQVQKALGESHLMTLSL